MLDYGLHNLGVSVLNQARQDFGAHPTSTLSQEEIDSARDLILGRTPQSRRLLDHWCTLAEMQPLTIIVWGCQQLVKEGS